MLGHGRAEQHLQSKKKKEKKKKSKHKHRQKTIKCTEMGQREGPYSPLDRLVQHRTPQRPLDRSGAVRGTRQVTSADLEAHAAGQGTQSLAKPGRIRPKPAATRNGSETVLRTGHSSLY